MPTKHIVSYLEQLELSEEEATLYLALLEKGPLSVRELAKIAKVKRTTAYIYIDALVEKELVMKIVRGSRKQVAAIPAEDSLKHLVESKVSKAKVLQEAFPSMLNSLTASLPKKQQLNDAEIIYYKGKNGVKKIYEEALRAKKLRSYFNMALIKDALPDNEILFSEALKKNKDIKIFELVQDTPLSRKRINESRIVSLNDERYSYKFLPEEVKLSAADILIYDNHVGIVNVSSQFTGVVLKNTDYYNNSRELFDLIWRVLPERKP